MEKLVVVLDLITQLSDNEFVTFIKLQHSKSEAESQAIIDAHVDDDEGLVK